MVSVGDVYSRHSFGVVTKVYPFEDKLDLKNSQGVEWTISGAIFERECKTAQAVLREEKVNRTQAIEILNSNAKTAMTVCFRRKVESNDVADKLFEIGDVTKLTQRGLRKTIKELLEGEQRIMIGHHNNSYDEHRRLRFEEHGAGMKLVDPRTIDYIIVGGTKYIVS